MDENTHNNVVPLVPQSLSTLVPNNIKLNFGEYLITQYPILKQTLSYLKIDDLSNALLVCKSWSQEVNNLFRRQRKINRIHWHVRSSEKHVPCDNDCVFRFRLENSENICFRSQIILAFRRESRKTCQLFSKIYTTADDNVRRIRDIRLKKPVPGLLGGLYFIHSWGLQILKCSCYEECQSSSKRRVKIRTSKAFALLFPEIEGCIVNSILVTHDSHATDSTTIEKILAPCARIGPLKGILVFDVSRDHRGLINSLFHNVLINNNGRPFAFGGGSFPEIDKCSKPSGSTIQLQDMLLICFYGENVRCYSAVTNALNATGVQNFMKKTRDALGSVDKKTQQRIAFVFRFIGLAQSIFDFENSLYDEYFSDTPAYIIITSTEFGVSHLTDCIEDYSEAKKFKLDYTRLNTEHSSSSVYFFVTVDLPV